MGGAHEVNYNGTLTSNGPNYTIKGDWDIEDFDSGSFVIRKKGGYDIDCPKKSDVSENKKKSHTPTVTPQRTEKKRQASSKSPMRTSKSPMRSENQKKKTNRNLNK